MVLVMNVFDQFFLEVEPLLAKMAIAMSQNMHPMLHLSIHTISEIAFVLAAVVAPMILFEVILIALYIVKVLHAVMELTVLVNLALNVMLGERLCCGKNLLATLATMVLVRCSLVLL